MLGRIPAYAGDDGAGRLILLNLRLYVLSAPAPCPGAPRRRPAWQPQQTDDAVPNRVEHEPENAHRHDTSAKIHRCARFDAANPISPYAPEPTRALSPGRARAPQCSVQQTLRRRGEAAMAALRAGGCGQPPPRPNESDVCVRQPRGPPMFAYSCLPRSGVINVDHEHPISESRRTRR
jgi:hypothetical protein